MRKQVFNKQQKNQSLLLSELVKLNEPLMNRQLQVCRLNQSVALNEPIQESRFSELILFE